MSDPQEAATPSDPHSAELIATLRREAALWDAEGPTPQMLLTAAEALEARDAEVAELKAKIAELEHQLKVQAFEHLRDLMEELGGGES